MEEKLLQKSLTTSQAQDLLRVHGKNEIHSEQASSVLRIFLSQFPTVTNAILLFAAVIFIFTGDIADSIFIFAVLFLNGLFGFSQEFSAEKSLEKLKSYTTPLVRAIRDGKQQEIASALLVPGDIVILSEGDRIPADGMLLRGHEVEIDESILTGESLPVLKTDLHKIFCGTLLTRGRGILQVTETGTNTRFGQIAQSLSSIKTEKTPLQKNLDGLGKTISLLIGLICLALFFISFLQGRNLASMFFVVISIGIAAIPEGLPAVVTIALALGTNRMAKKKTIVRQMPAIETLGATQVILTDKTGTLTENSMRVKHFYLHKENAFTYLVQACVLGNTASLIKRADTNDYETVGDKTDGALLLWVHEQHKSIDEILKLGKVIDEHVFDTDRRTITTVWQYKEKKHIFVRGAPEVIIEKSTLSEKEKQEMIHTYESFARQGLRVIGFGMKIQHSDTGTRDELEDGLTFLGFIGVYDPPRQEVKKAIHDAKQAGIHVAMVTGDNELTALAIAKEIGLVSENEDILTGDDLKKLSDEQLIPLLLRTSIYARTKPEDKLRLVGLFQKQNYVVGVTGDGVNDSLALKRANVGIAMGKSGTDVAKEASDIIITDDNFATLVRAIEEGRIIYQNIIKAIVYLLTSNLSELMLVFGSTLLGLPVPLLPTQILWINLATDGLPALALATDTKGSAVLLQKPRDTRTPILTLQRFIYITSRGVGLAILLIGGYAFLLHFTSHILARSVIFNVLIISHLFLAFIIRGQSPLKATRFFLFSILITLLMQLIIMNVPFFQHLFQVSLFVH